MTLLLGFPTKSVLPPPAPKLSIWQKLLNLLKKLWP